MKRNFFYDTSSLRWFMLDSLRSTLIENTGIANIYYTMDGGKQLVLDELGIETVFPADVPYMGSPFYFAHTDVRGEDGTASIRIDGDRRFVACYASGAVEAEGHLEYIEDANGVGCYELYRNDDTAFACIIFNSADSFHLKDNENAVYILKK